MRFQCSRKRDRRLLAVKSYIRRCLEVFDRLVSWTLTTTLTMHIRDELEDDCLCLPILYHLFLKSILKIQYVRQAT